MSNPGPITNEQAYKQFLQEIGYLLPEPEGDCTVQTTNIDPEISTIAGPQKHEMAQKYYSNGTGGHITDDSYLHCAAGATKTC